MNYFFWLWDLQIIAELKKCNVTFDYLITPHCLNISQIKKLARNSTAACKEEMIKPIKNSNCYFSKVLIKASQMQNTVIKILEASE